MEFLRTNEVRWLFDHRNKPGEEETVKVIAGLRRVGKSYLLGKLFSDHLQQECHIESKNICSIDLSKIPNDEIRTAEKLKERIVGALAKNKALAFVFIDEVQLAGVGFAETIKTLAKSYPSVDFYVTGSTSELTSSEILAQFGSESASLLVRPLPYREVKETLPSISVLDYLSSGGIPKVLLALDPKEKEDALSSLLEDVFVNDVLDQAKKQGLGEGETRRIIHYLLANVANFTAPETLAQGISGVSRWALLKPEEKEKRTVSASRIVEDIKKTYLLEEVEEKGIEGEKLLLGRNKLYCVDLGLLNAATSFHPDITKRYENAVYLDLISRGYRVLVERYEEEGADKFGEPVSKEKEIDFIADRGEEHLSLQVAFRFSSPKRFHDETDRLADYAKVSRCYCISQDLAHPQVPGVEFLTLEELFNKKDF